MLEKNTYELILQRMLDRVPDDIDKREGTSMIWNALAPAAAELAQAYIELHYAKNSISPDTSSGDELTEYAFERGVFRKGATKALRKGIFNKDVPINSRFSAEMNTYLVLEKIKDFEYKLECEQTGEMGNYYTGPLVPVEYIDGLTSAELTDVIVPAVNEETDEQLRQRLRQSLIDPAQDGNIAQYKQWADEYEGIGVAKVFPLWNGGNTVKVAITNRLFQVADSTLVNEFQEYLDPGSQGLGNGKAPLGSKVTVAGGVRKDINITGNVVLAEGYTEPEGVSEAISEYLASVTYVKNSVSYMRVAVAILDLPSIVDLNNFTVNGGTTDIELIDEEIPTLNSINLTAV
jgi:uncharacterized phage protein gp47/JayE